MTFVPFVVKGWTPPEHTHPSSEFPALQDLHMWPYSESLKSQLRERLPHRAARIEIAGSDMRDPGELPPGLALVDIWSFGIGHATFVDTVDTHEPAVAVDWDRLRDDIAKVWTRDRFLNRTTPLANALTAKRVDPPLWAQQMLLVEAPPSADLDAMEEVARRLSPDGEALAGTAEPGSASVWLGVKACVVAQRSVTATRDALARVLAAQTAIWAAALDFDFQLLTMLDQNPRKLSLHELEQRSMELLDLYEHVQRFRAEIEMIPLHLAGGDKEIWDRVNGVWRLNDQLSSLDTSLNACEHVYAHSATSLTTRQGRFLNGVVLAVTMLSLATFLLTAWDFTQKAFDAFDWISLAVVVASLVLSVVLFHRVWTSATGRRLIADLHRALRTQLGTRWPEARRRRPSPADDGPPAQP
jgi:hypothetical protein